MRALRDDPTLAVDSVDDLYNETLNPGVLEWANNYMAPVFRCIFCNPLPWDWNGIFAAGLC